MSIVLDSSAVLALMLGETGGDAVQRRLGGAALCAVNLSEIMAKLLDRGYDVGVAGLALDGLSLRIVAFDGALAVRAGVLRSRYRRSGLSSADCACLALAAETNRPALTGDRLWGELDHGIAVEVFR